MKGNHGARPPRQFSGSLNQFGRGKALQETRAGLAFIPLLATMGFYALPPQWQSEPSIQFAPQIFAYLALGVWASCNDHWLLKLGLCLGNIRPGLLWGTITGISLGLVNTGVILYIVPALGMEIAFLSHTPHAQVPFWIMVPWFIMVIAMAVELNFRGFLLGRLLLCFGQTLYVAPSAACQFRLQTVLPLGLSTFTFAFDPFLVTTFRHLHWIAVWDGLVWGWMWIRMHNLYAVMTAHAAEVIILYVIIRGVLA